MAKCEICGKTKNWGNKLSIARSHISNRATRTFAPNIRRVKAEVNGETKKVNVCTTCLRSGKVKRA